MPITLYATVTDLQGWLGGSPLPDNALSLLRSASLLVAKALDESLYNPGTLHDEPRRDATCAQAEAWSKAGIDPAAGTPGISATVKQKSLASGTIVYDTPTAQEREAALTALAPDAYNILYAAGLLASLLLPVWNTPIDTNTYLNGHPNALGFGYGGY